MTGTKSGYSSVTRESAATPVVAKGDLSLTPLPTIGGTPQFGATLTADAGGWDPGTALSYEWMVDGTPPSVSSSSSYVIRAGDVGRSITVSVTGTKPGYHPVTRTTATTAVAAASLADGQCAVAVTGKAKVGKTLTGAVENCPAGATIHYAWYAGSKAIKGATGATYKLKKKQAGKRIKLMVSVTLPGYVAVLRSSDATGKVRT